MTTRTMTVTVFDRAEEERTWGTRAGGPILRTVTVPATCPRCGGPRGDVREQRQHDDGEWVSVSRWENPCGHVDGYRAVLAEADAASAPV